MCVCIAKLLRAVTSHEVVFSCPGCAPRLLPSVGCVCAFFFSFFFEQTRRVSPFRSCNGAQFRLPPAFLRLNPTQRILSPHLKPRAFALQATTTRRQAAVFSFTIALRYAPQCIGSLADALHSLMHTLCLHLSLSPLFFPPLSAPKKAERWLVGQNAMRTYRITTSSEIFSCTLPPDFWVSSFLFATSGAKSNFWWLAHSLVLSRHGNKRHKCSNCLQHYN